MRGSSSQSDCVHAVAFVMQWSPFLSPPQRGTGRANLRLVRSATPRADRFSPEPFPQEGHGEERRAWSFVFRNGGTVAVRNPRRTKMGNEADGIHVDTRAEAIAGGVLIDVTESAKQSAFAGRWR